MRSANPSIGNSPTKKPGSNSNHSTQQFEFYATLALNRLTTLDADTAKALAESKGQWLILGALTTLDAVTAKALAEFKGQGLALNRLTTLDADTAKGLAEFKGGKLNLRALTTLDAQTAKALAEFQGDQLWLPCLTKLDAESAKALARFKGKGVDIDRLNRIAASSPAERSERSALGPDPLEGSSRVAKRPVAFPGPAEAAQSSPFRWPELIGLALLLAALGYYLIRLRLRSKT